MGKEGIAGLYHGLLPTLLRDVPDIAIQFTLYERLRKALERRRAVAKLRTWEHLILGGFAGGTPLCRDLHRQDTSICPSLLADSDQSGWAYKAFAAPPQVAQLGADYPECNGTVGAEPGHDILQQIRARKVYPCRLCCWGK